MNSHRLVKELVTKGKYKKEHGATCRGQTAKNRVAFTKKIVLQAILLSTISTFGYKCSSKSKLNDLTDVVKYP